MNGKSGLKAAAASSMNHDKMNVTSTNLRKALLKKTEAKTNGKI
ncbi:Hypothetical protein LOCK908_2831 [Lacticaseibacillus rhamnosus LOCK908]|jgi:hypothetical protein|uniref:Uncharacterized protein n=1 Tax=Lacticaseibacillus rhamnosus (strain LMS2-1) TaxID=525361 RepID=C2JUI4_LACRM|nr:conserved hypothetical protein [Lacticaseibacillus rhamnosus ATCC 8530]AGP75437.1 Hypothetical protein LOCK908_2831 [Lacticaseibacillus rhamnosus LOCK908]EEN81244.1 hypothetical protein HMPREF0539_0568 [Lacticaseibacillus rhamnosus LMS2-1]ETW66977.1 hypothetical protein N577_015410 [Lacticaseibacillus rhamnosus 2166]